MLRGLNVGGHHKIPMESLRALYKDLGWPYARSFIQSGNVVFQVKKPDLAGIADRIEGAIEHTFGFRAPVFLRTAGEMRGTIARNPFLKRAGIDPTRLLVTFLAHEPQLEARDKLRALDTEPEEIRIHGRELYAYFPDGMARPRITMTAIEKMLKTPGTGRNWNTVTKLAQMAEEMEDGTV